MSALDPVIVRVVLLCFVGVSILKDSPRWLSDRPWNAMGGIYSETETALKVSSGKTRAWGGTYSRLTPNHEKRFPIYTFHMSTVFIGMSE